MMKGFLRKIGRRVSAPREIGQVPGLDIGGRQAARKYDLETNYVSRSGVSLPVYRDYRYSVKEGWRYYGPLSALSDLADKGLLDDADRAFLGEMTGGRTLPRPLGEAYEVLRKYRGRHPEIFLVEEVPELGKRLLKTTREEAEKEISVFESAHRARLERVKNAGLLDMSRPARILEIGYTSGGVSILAFERLGFEAHAIDYYFNESVTATSRHEHIRQLVGGGVSYHVGDMTKRTVFEDGFFDLVFSSSVIEHILDLPAAFREVHRVLKKDGVFISNYGAFHARHGGHSPGIPDSPWAHLRLPWDEYLVYLREMRPHEADIAIPWIENSLCPGDTISKVQHDLLAAGFSIKSWRKSEIPGWQKAELDYEVMRDCFRNYSSLTIDDLVTRGMEFISLREDIDGNGKRGIKAR